MVLSHPESLGRCHQHSRAAAHLQGDRFGRERVGADRTGGAVLFGGPQRDDHPLAGLQIALHLGPAAQGKTDRFGGLGGAGQACSHAQWAVPLPSY